MRRGVQKKLKNPKKKGVKRHQVVCVRGAHGLTNLLGRNDFTSGGGGTKKGGERKCLGGTRKAGSHRADPKQTGRRPPRTPKG